MSGTVTALQRALDYIETHLADERLAIAQVAEAAYMSVPNLYRVFYALTGHPLKEYIRKRRISEAAAMLRVTALPVIDVAFACGFDAYRTFASAFKKQTGVTPGVYRTQDIYYSFEPIHLQEHVDYAEDRELTGRHPDVKVVRLQPQRMIVYRHEAGRREGLEEAAFRTFAARLAAAGSMPEGRRLFGYNLEPDDGGRHVYVTMTPADGLALPAGCETVQFEGGLFAASLSPVHSEAAIVETWNRLLAEWLPRSTFALGGMPFVEEARLTARGGGIARMKLYLPVVRKQEQETIEVVTLEERRAIAFHAAGERAFERADEALIEWLQLYGHGESERIDLAMRCSYGASAGDEWFELALLLPDGQAVPSDAALTRLGGGLYACMTTGAYGAMTGVLDRIYRWIAGDERYRPDETRSWYARYVPGDPADLERTTRVVCCVPVRLA